MDGAETPFNASVKSPLARSSTTAMSIFLSVSALLSTIVNRNTANSSPSNAVALFQEAYHNVCTGISRHTSKLCIEDEHSNGATWNSIVRTKRVLKTGSKSGDRDWDLRKRFGMRLVAVEVASYILIPAPVPTSRPLSDVPRPGPSTVKTNYLGPNLTRRP